jgi:hypothetical protein
MMKCRVLEHTWLVVDTADVETLVACEESCNLSVRRPIGVILVYQPFPLTVTGVMDARFSIAAGEAATVAARTAAMAPDFIVTR